jgi:LA2681-like HEPN
MALCNLAHHLVIYALAFEGHGTRALLLRKALECASAALGANAIYTDPRDERNREIARQVKQCIESESVHSEAAQSTQKLEPSATLHERDYRHWCAMHKLYLDPANDIDSDLTDLQDWFGLPGHVVPIDTPDVFDGFFEQVKQEYVSARWLLYQGLQRRSPHFSDAKVRLHVTRPRSVFSLSIEQVKSAYRTAYSIFDKVSVFLNAYMNLGIPERDVSFRRIWRSKGHPLRREFDQLENWGFCALYWTASDFFEDANDDVAEPQAKDLTRIRNYLEHNYLQVTSEAAQRVQGNTLAYTVERNEFEAKALHLLQRARAALIYLAIGVQTEEARRAETRGDLGIEDLPDCEEIPDSEKV